MPASLCNQPLLLANEIPTSKCEVALNDVDAFEARVMSESKEIATLYSQKSAF